MWWHSFYASASHPQVGIHCEARAMMDYLQHVRTENNQCEVVFQWHSPSPDKWQASGEQLIDQAKLQTYCESIASQFHCGKHKVLKNVGARFGM